MKLSEAESYGKECGLETIEECVNSITIHAESLFPQPDIEEELSELEEEYENFTGSQAIKEFPL